MLETVKRIQVQKYNKETDPEAKSKIELNPLKVFYAAVENCKPVLQLTPVKRGGATYQVFNLKLIYTKHS
jgi:small subunit ribosomal protein S7